MSQNISPVNAQQYSWQSTYVFSAAAIAALDTIYLGALNGPLTIAAVGNDAGIVATVQGSVSSPTDIEAGNGIWVDITGLTAIANVAKQVSVPGPYTAIRGNVTTAVSSKTLTISVRMASYSVYTNG